MAATKSPEKTPYPPISFHTIRVGENCWTEAEDRVIKYMERSKTPRPCEIWLGEHMAYRVWPGRGDAGKA